MVDAGPILLIETSTPTGSLAVLSNGRIAFASEFQSDRSHNSALFAPLQDALAAADGHAFARVLAGTGPGSYSGTRVGIAAAQGVALAHGCPAIGISSLLASPAVRSGERCFAVGDARRGSGWHAEFGGGRMVRGPELYEWPEMGRVITRALEDGVVVFSFEPCTSADFPASLAEHVRIERPTAAGLGMAWLAMDDAGRAACEAVPPQPVYLRPPHITEAKRGHPLKRG